MRTENSGVRAAKSGMKTAKSGVRTANSGMKTAEWCKDSKEWYEGRKSGMRSLSTCLRNIAEKNLWAPDFGDLANVNMIMYMCHIPHVQAHSPTNTSLQLIVSTL